MSEIRKVRIFQDHTDGRTGEKFSADPINGTEVELSIEDAEYVTKAEGARRAEYIAAIAEREELSRDEAPE